LSSGLQFEPGDKLTNWKPWRPDFNESVLDLWQGEDKTQIFRLRSTSIDHEIIEGGGEGYDWGTATDCYYYLRKKSATLGGVHVGSFTEDTAAISYELYAVYGAASTGKTTDTDAAITFAALKADTVTGEYKECLAGENLFCLKTKPKDGSYKAIFLIDQEGDVLYDSSIGLFQDEDDIELLGELEDILGDKIPRGQMKEKNVAKKHKIVYPEEVEDVDIYGKKTGKKSFSRFISSKKRDMLVYGAIRQTNEKMKENIKQLNEKIDKLEARLN